MKFSPAATIFLATMTTCIFPGAFGQEIGVVKPHALENFKRQHHLKQGAHTFQEVPRGAESVDIDGQLISLRDEDLTPLNVFTKNAKFVVDGQEQLILLTDYASKEDPDVIVTKDVNGALVAASKMAKEWVVEVAPILGSDIFVTIAPEDLEKDAVGEVEDDEIFDVGTDKLADAPEDESGNRMLRGVAPSPNRRWLQEGCPFTDYVEVHLVLDSYFVAGAGEGSAELAKEKITNAIASANKLYMEPFCVQFQISKITVYANPTADPMRALVSSAPDICRLNYRGEILYTFADEISKAGKEGDLASFISGREFSGSCYGQAFTSKVGRNNYIGGAYGLSVQNMVTPSSRLFAHEAGHNLGAQHPMFPDRNAPYDYGSQNIDWMKGFIEEKICAPGQDDYTCVTRVPVTTPSTDNPTQSPTKKPTSRPSKSPTEKPSGTPTKSPTKAPTKAPTKTPTQRPTANPSNAPTGCGTDSQRRQLLTEQEVLLEQECADSSGVVSVMNRGTDQEVELHCSRFANSAHTKWYCENFGFIARGCPRTCGVCSS